MRRIPMREVVKIPGYTCANCLHYFCGAICMALHAPDGWIEANRGEGTHRHRDCPYGNRVITVVMTDEEGEG
jgi:hypothetical protein